MIWSLARVLFFVAAVAALAFGLGLLIERGEGVRIAVAGWEFTLGPVVATALLVALVVVVWLGLRLAGLAVATLRFLAGDETAVSRYFDRTRARRGQAALTEALLALAAGDGRQAAERAAQAGRLIDQPVLTTLISAQAARMTGDRARATEAYRKLLAHDPARFVAIRGLMQIKLDEGETETALQLAQKAFALRPGHQPTQEALLSLQTRAHDWTGARATLRAQAGSGALPRDVWKRRDAVLALQEAREILDPTAPIEAREAAIAANRASPDLIPAAVMAADALVAAGSPKKGARILEKAWSVRPHPDLAAAYARLAPDESPAQRLRRFGALWAANPSHDETRLTEAELQIAAEDFPAARRALGDLPTRHPTARTLTLMAAIERGEGGSEAAVRGWLARALAAPRGPQWTCAACHTPHAAWTAVCDSCGGFDTLDWTEAGGGALPAGEEMLPLIVGTPAPRPTEQPRAD
ncbi:MAG: heme biosynthesis protein HemY [Gemmobacter sp.]